MLRLPGSLAAPGFYRVCRAACCVAAHLLCVHYLAAYSSGSALSVESCQPFSDTSLHTRHQATVGYCSPQGGWEDDETVDAAARRETVEEAGVRGELEVSKGRSAAAAQALVLHHAKRH